jgi:hypothetical protein
LEGLSKAQKAADLARVQQRRAMEAAYEAAIVLSLAEDTPATLDPPPGTPGARSDSWAPEGELPGVSEFFGAELAVVLNCGRGTAAHLARRAWTWRESLPATFAALGRGEIDERRARELAEVLGNVRPAVARAWRPGCCTKRARCRCGRCGRGLWRWPSSWMPTSPRRGA